MLLSKQEQLICNQVDGLKDESLLMLSELFSF